ncbi:MAG: HIT family protein [Candidatus Muiribacteriota bacterium]|jgi:histidine triad (HIT) family protein
MENCIFCKFAHKEITPTILWEDEDLMIFLDKFPIREGHCLIIPKKHYETFEELPEKLASKLFLTAQKLAKQLKHIYKVERIGFVFTGGDIAHAHAHLVPMIDKNHDITSERYILNSDKLKYSSAHLEKSQQELENTREKINFTL